MGVKWVIAGDRCIVSTQPVSAIIILPHYHFPILFPNLGGRGFIKRTLRSLVSALPPSVCGNLLFCSVVRQESQGWRKRLLPFYIRCKSKWNDVHQHAELLGESRFAAYLTKTHAKVLEGLTATKPIDRAEFSLTSCSCSMEEGCLLSETDSPGFCPKSHPLPQTHVHTPSGEPPLCWLLPFI